MGEKVKVRGEQIHLTDSTNNPIVDFSLYGKAEQKQYSGKNLLQNTATSQTVNGVTFTVNDDGSVKLAETCTGSELVYLNNNILLEDGSYIASVGENIRLRILGYSSSWVELGNSSNGLVAFNAVSETYSKYMLQVGIESGKTYNTTIYPMISIEGGEYEPYVGGIASPNPDYPQEITVAGESYNLLENTATSTTSNGVTFTVNNDGSVTANGTATSNAFFALNPIELDGKYIMSGCPRNTGNYWMYGQENSVVDTGNGITFEYSGSFTPVIRINSGITVSNLTFYPMIRKASVKNDRYMPYGKGSVEVKSVGNQLVNLPNVESVVLNGVTWSCGNGIVKVSGTPTETSSSQGANIYYDLPIVEGDYRVSGSTPSVVVYVAIKNADGTNKYIGDAPFILDGTEQRCRVFCQTRGNVSGGINETVYPMLNKGTTALPFEPYKETISTIPTPNGLCGIKVSSGGNYTDENGQQWVCDEVVKYADGSGKRIQRIGKAVFDGSDDEEWSDRTSEYTEKIGNQRRYSTVDIEEYRLIQNVPCISSIGYVGTIAGKEIYSDNGLSLYWLPNSTDRIAYVTIDNEDVTDLNTFKSWLSSNPITVYYELAEPIITDLSAEEIAEIEKLYTFYPVTNIYNDADCGMILTYFSTKLEFLEPKTDWTKNDAFDYIAYNRVTNNIMYLKELANYLFSRLNEFNLETEKDNLSLIYARHMNDIENELESINLTTYKLGIGEKKTYKPNGNVPDYQEYNRIESACLALYNEMQIHKANLPRLAFRLGNQKGIRV